MAYTGGRISDITVSSGGNVTAKGGVFNSVTLAGGILALSGGVMSNSTIHSGSILFGSQSAVFSDTRLQSSGTISLTSDCTHYGTLILENSASFQANGARIDMDISERSTYDGAIIVNQNFLYGGKYSVTVSSDQALGKYVLATNSTSYSFSSGVDLFVDGGNSSCGKLYLSQSFIYNGKCYTLSSDYFNTLSLNISAVYSLSQSTPPQEEFQGVLEGEFSSLPGEDYNSTLLSGADSFEAAGNTADIADYEWTDILRNTGNTFADISGCTPTLFAESREKESVSLIA